MTAAFLYCGGYRAIISSARFRFSALNSNGIWGGVRRSVSCVSLASWNARSAPWGYCTACPGATSISHKPTYPLLTSTVGRTTNSASDRRHAEALSARRLAEGALCSTRLEAALTLFDAARAASRGSIVAVAVGDDEQMEGGMGGANGERNVGMLIGPASAGQLGPHRPGRLDSASAQRLRAWEVQLRHTDSCLSLTPMFAVIVNDERREISNRQQCPCPRLPSSASSTS